MVRMNTPAFQPPPGFELDDLFSGTRKRRRRGRGKRTEFADLPIGRRRDMAVSMGWKIRCYPDGAGEFSSHDYIPGDRKWPVDANNTLACQWADIFFVGRDYRRRGVFYNTTIETVASRLANKIEQEALDILHSRMGGPDSDSLVVYTKKDKRGTAMVFAPHKPIDAFGGMTRDGKLAELIDDLAAGMHERQDIQGFTRIEPGYRYGVGLDMVVPDPGLTVEGIARWVRRYRHDGEGDLAWACEDREQVVAQVRSALAQKSWSLRVRQARDLGLDAPAPFMDPIGEAMAGSGSNAIKV